MSQEVCQWSYSDPFDIVKDIHNILSDMRGKPWKIWMESVQQSNFAILWQDYGSTSFSGKETPEQR